MIGKWSERDDDKLEKWIDRWFGFCFAIAAVMAVIIWAVIIWAIVLLVLHATGG